jgi:hypothetical protein
MMLRSRLSRARGPLGYGATLVAISCISACGSSGTATLNTVRVERAVANSILKERGLYTTVTCPSKVLRKAGRIFVCQARLSVGVYPVSVTETNANGHVSYENRTPLVVLKNIASIERAIRASIARQRHLRSTVSCPAAVLQQAGLTFTCEATVNGRQYPFSVTEIEGEHVRYAAA